jgi:hypothetical protein
MSGSSSSYRDRIYIVKDIILKLLDETQFGKRTVTIYKPTEIGVEFCRSILDPYEKMFPRRRTIDGSDEEEDEDG